MTRFEVPGADKTLTEAAAKLRDQGWELFQNGQRDPAARLLAESLRLNPRDAKTLWFSALVLDRAGRYEQALQTLRAARRADETLNFVANAAEVETKERSLERKIRASGTAKSSASEPSTEEKQDVPTDNASPDNASANRENTNRQSPAKPPALISDEILRELKESGVYVAPAMQHYVEARPLSAALRATNPRNIAPHAIVIERLPSGVRNARQLAENAHDLVALGDRALVIVLAGREVAAYGAGLSSETLQKIVDNAGRTFDSETYAAGLAQIARAADDERGQNIALGLRVLLVLCGIVVGIIFLLKRAKRKRRAAHLLELRNNTQQLSQRLATQLATLDADFEYALLQQNPGAHKPQLEEARHEAGEAFFNSMTTLREAQTTEQFEVALSALQKAGATLQNSRGVLENANRIRANVVPHNAVVQNAAAQDAPDDLLSTQYLTDDPDIVEIAPLGADLPDAHAGYALDFFTSQPVLRAEMVPVDLEIDGQRKRVWAQRDSALRAADGIAEIGTLDDGSGPRIWFDVPEYNAWQSDDSQTLRMMPLDDLLPQMSAAQTGDANDND